MLNYVKGDLFSCVSHKVVLAHACNPFGSWSGGIAVQFRKRYPLAYKQYAKFCHENSKDATSLLGKCLLVPVDGIYIACLFTSDFKCSSEEILEYTDKSISHLARQLAELPDLKPDHPPVVNMPQINSGIFNVPWEKTEQVLGECNSLLFKVYII